MVNRAFIKTNRYSAQERARCRAYSRVTFEIDTDESDSMGKFLIAYHHYWNFKLPMANILRTFVYSNRKRDIYFDGIDTDGNCDFRMANQSMIIINKEKRYLKISIPTANTTVTIKDGKVMFGEEYLREQLPDSLIDSILDGINRCLDEISKHGADSIKDPGKFILRNIAND